MRVNLFLLLKSSKYHIWDTSAFPNKTFGCPSDELWCVQSETTSPLPWINSGFTSQNYSVFFLSHISTSNQILHCSFRYLGVVTQLRNVTITLRHLTTSYSCPLKIYECPVPSRTSNVPSEIPQFFSSKMVYHPGVLQCFLPKISTAQLILGWVVSCPLHALLLLQETCDKPCSRPPPSVVAFLT